MAVGQVSNHIEVSGSILATASPIFVVTVPFLSILPEVRRVYKVDNPYSGGCLLRQSKLYVG